MFYMFFIIIISTIQSAIARRKGSSGVTTASKCPTVSSRASGQPPSQIPGFSESPRDFPRVRLSSCLRNPHLSMFFSKQLFRPSLLFAIERRNAGALERHSVVFRRHHRRPHFIVVFRRRRVPVFACDGERVRRTEQERATAPCMLCSREARWQKAE